MTTTAGSSAAPSAEAVEATRPALLNYSRRRKSFLLITLLLSWILANADRIAMSISIVPISTEFGLGPGVAGIVLSAFYISYALMQLCAGWMADRFGSRNVLVFSVACWSVFTALTGVAFSVVSLVIVRVLFGIGEGGFAPASSVTIAEAFPKPERARAKSLVIGASFLGSAIGAGAIGALIATHGWRTAYHFFGYLGIAIAVILWAAVKKPTHRHDAAANQGRFRTLVHDTAIRRTLVIYLCGNVVLIGLASWMPAYLVNTRHVDILHAGILSALPNLVAFCSLNVVGWLLDRYPGRERLFLAVGAALMTLFFALMALASTLPVLIGLWTLCLMGYTLIYGATFAIPLKLLPEHSIGTAVGILNFGGQVGSGFAPAIIGFLTGFAHGAATPAYCFLLALGFIACLVAITWRTARNPEPLLV